MGNSLDSARTASEKLKAIQATQKYNSSRRRKAAGTYFLIIVISLAVAALTVYTLMTREATTLFKLALILEILVALGMFIAFCCCADKADDGITAICLIMAIVHIILSGIMVTRGRFKIDEVVTGSDGFVYDVIDGEYYLYDCGNKVTDIVVSELDQPIVGFSDGLKGNNKITSVTIDVPEFTIKKGAFAGCENLKSIKFGNGSYTIGARAFKNCQKLESVVFDGGNYTFKDQIFKKCSNLENVYLNGGSYGRGESWNWSTYTKTFKGVKNVVLHLNDNPFINNTVFDASDILTTVVYVGTDSINNVNTDVLVFKEGFNFENWTDSRKQILVKYSIAASIYLPSSVTSIPENFFGNNGDAPQVYYQGSSDMWQNIHVDGYHDVGMFGAQTNKVFTKINVRYNSSCKYWETNEFEIGN